MKGTSSLSDSSFSVSWFRECLLFCSLPLWWIKAQPCQRQKTVLVSERFMSSVTECQPQIHWMVSLLKDVDLLKGLRVFIHRQTSGHLDNGGPYLTSSCVEPQRGQVGVKNHVTGLDVNRRLSLPNDTQIPGWVHQTPEGWDWWWRKRGWKRKRNSDYWSQWCVCVCANHKNRDKVRRRASL